MFPPLRFPLSKRATSVKNRRTRLLVRTGRNTTVDETTKERKTSVRRRAVFSHLRDSTLHIQRDRGEDISKDHICHSPRESPWISVVFPLKILPCAVFILPCDEWRAKRVNKWTKFGNKGETWLTPTCSTTRSQIFHVLRLLLSLLLCTFPQCGLGRREKIDRDNTCAVYDPTNSYFEILSCSLQLFPLI